MTADLRPRTRYTPGSPDDLAAREAWCVANGYEVGRNGWISPDAAAAYRQHEIDTRTSRRLADARATD